MRIVQDFGWWPLRRLMRRRRPVTVKLGAFLSLWMTLPGFYILQAQTLPPAHLIAQNALSRGDTATAHAQLRKLIATQPPLPRAYERLAESYIDNDRIAEGIHIFRTLSNNPSGDANAHAGLAMLYNAAGNADSALAHGLRAVRGGAPIVPACEIAVHLARAQRKDTLLTKHVQARLGEKPADFAAGYTHAYVAYADGRLQDAEAELHVLQKHHPRDWRLFHLRSLVEVECRPIDHVLASIQRGLSHAQHTGDDEGVAFLLFRMAYTHLLRNDARRAAVSMKPLTASGMLSKEVRRLGELGMAMYDQVIFNFEKATPELENLRGLALKRHDGILASMAGWTACKAHLQAGNFGAAEYSILQAKEIADSLRITTMSLTYQAYLGYARERLGLYDIASTQYSLVAKNLKAIGALQHLPYVWSGLARISMHEAKLSEAKTRRQQQLSLSREMGRWDLQMDGLIEVARIYLGSNQADSVRQTLDAASRLFTVYETTRDRINLSLLEGDFARQQGNYDLAMQEYERARRLAPHYSPQAPGPIYLKIADLLLKQEKCEAAIQAYGNAYDAVLKRVLNEGLEKGQLDLAASREVIISYVKGLVHCGRYVEGFDKVRQGQLLILRELEVAQERARRDGGGQALALIHQIEELRSRIPGITGDDSSSDQTRLALMNKIDLLRRRLLSLGLPRDSPMDSSWSNRVILGDSCSLDSLQKSLSRQGAVALVYSVGNNAIIAFALHADALQAFVIPGFDRRSLRKLVKRLNPLLTFDGNMPLSVRLKNRLQFDLERKAARELVGALVTPLLMNRSPKKLIIIPDDVLCILPFDALMLAADSTGVGFEHIPFIQVGLDFRDLLLPTTLDSARTLIMANGQAVDIPGATFELPPLVLAWREARGIAGRLPANSFSLLRDEHATREEFRTKASEYDVLHLAMHANLSDWLPEFAQLYFCGAGGESEPLYGYEISQMRLRPGLVVLSACNAAIGHFRPGYGLLSFVLNFVDAGVPSVVASQWQVEEKTTEILMVEFYEQLSRGMAFSEALALAKLKLIEEGYADPYYWAGFVLYGRDGSIDFADPPRSTVFYIAAFIILGGLLGFVLLRRRGRPQKPPMQP